MKENEKDNVKKRLAGLSLAWHKATMVTGLYFAGALVRDFHKTYNFV